MSAVEGGSVGAAGPPARAPRYKRRKLSGSTRTSSYDGQIVTVEGQVVTGWIIINVFEEKGESDSEKKDKGKQKGKDIRKGRDKRKKEAGGSDEDIDKTKKFKTKEEVIREYDGKEGGSGRKRSVEEDKTAREKRRRYKDQEGRVSFPFHGRYEGVGWNSQAFLCRKIWKRQRKKALVSRLLEKRDFFCLADTHGGRLEGDGFTPPEGTEAWFSEGTAQRGGVGVIVKKKFLERFSYIDWEEVVEGRAAVLHLDGKEGAMDIWATYFPTGSLANCINEEQGEFKKRRGEDGSAVAPPKVETRNIDWEGLRKQRNRLREIIARRVKEFMGTSTLRRKVKEGGPLPRAIGQEKETRERRNIGLV